MNKKVFLRVVALLLSLIMLVSCNVNIDTSTSTTTQNKIPEQTPNVDNPAKKYSITYDCSPGVNSPNNPSNYSVGSEFVLEPATLPGYTFVNWIDENGAVVNEITDTTEGNISLRAKWCANRNVSYPISSINDPVYPKYDFFEEGDEYVFIYYLGYIDRVPLDAISDAFEHTTLTENGYEKHFTSASTTVQSIQQSTSKITQSTDSWQMGAEVSAGVNCFISIGFKFSTQISGSTTNVIEDGQITVMSNENVASQETTISFTSNHPHGHYRYTNFALVDVFAVITYNPTTKKYSVSNVNSVRNVWQGLDYSAFSKGFDDNENIDLPFVFPDNIEETVNEMAHSYTPGLQWLETTDEYGHPIAYVTGYTGTERNITIPSFYCDADGKPHEVVGIKNLTGSLSGGVFANSNITSIKFGKHVKSIDAYSFYNCTSLSITIPDSIETIGEFAFAGCTSLSEIYLGENISYLGEKVFYGCEDLVLKAELLNNSTIINAGKSGAGTIKILIPENAKIKNIDNLLVYDTTNYFELNGNSKTFQNVYIHSNAFETYISDLSVNNLNGGTGVCLGSSKITLYNVDITMGGNSGTAMELFADEADLTIRGTVTLTGAEGAPIAGNGMIAKNINIKSTDEKTLGDLKITGGTGYPNGTGGVALTAQSISVIGYLNVTINGGKGFDVYNRDIGDGNNGGVGIISEFLFVELFSTTNFIVNGGGGGNAYHRDSGDNAGDGKNGRDGFRGGDGATAIECSEVEFKSGNIIITGGKGGGGGDASECNYAWSSEVRGGRGGDGGNAGAGIIANTLTIHDNSGLYIAANGGIGGYTGKRGGVHKNDHGDGWADAGWAKDGYEGTPGKGNVAISINCEIHDPANKLIAINGEQGWIDTSLNQC